MPNDIKFKNPKRKNPHKRIYNLQEDTAPEIKYHSSYSIKVNTPFIKKLEILNKLQGKCLIDTGAECSVINAELIPPSIKIHNDKTKLKSVLGEELKTLGKIKDVKAQVGTEDITLDAIVKTNEIYSTII